VFTFYYLIKISKYPYPEELSNKFLDEIKKYKSWYSNSDQERLIKRELINYMMEKNSFTPGEIAEIIRDAMDKLKGALGE
jgi:predicted house-cleaning noncanonical NTP pyrophosphatase (MazG superfamily)